MIIVTPQEPSILVPQSQLRAATSVAAGVWSAAFTLFLGGAIGALTPGAAAISAIKAGKAVSDEGSLQAFILIGCGAAALVTGVIAAIAFGGHLVRVTRLWQNGEHFEYFESENKMVRVVGQKASETY